MDKWVTLKQVLEYDLQIFNAESQRPLTNDNWSYGQWVRSAADIVQRYLDLMAEMEKDDGGTT